MGVDFRSFETMGHSMHGQDPQPFTGALVDWAEKVDRSDATTRRVNSLDEVYGSLPDDLNDSGVFIDCAPTSIGIIDLAQLIEDSSSGAAPRHSRSSARPRTSATSFDASRSSLPFPPPPRVLIRAPRAGADRARV